MILEKEKQYKELKPVHRIDKNTSGVLVFAKTKKFASSFQKALVEKSLKGEEDEVNKTYLARVNGHFPDTLDVNLPIELTYFGAEKQNKVSDDGIEAKSSFKLLRYDQDSDTSVIECHPHTGRTHQLRIHLQSAGYPICNDSAYLLHRIHNARKEDGDIELYHQLQQQYHWEIDSSCDDCNNPKGDPLDNEIWLHAYSYRFNEHTWKTSLPYWYDEKFNVKDYIEQWNKIQ